MPGETLHRHANARRRLPAVSFVGVPRGAFRAAVARVFPAARFLPRRPARAITGSDLAIRVFDIGDAIGRLAFTRAASRRQVASLGIELGNDLLIGPLTLPGRPGCGYCGAERMRAASTALDIRESSRQARTGDGMIGALLAREVHALVRNGLERCGVLDHVLAVNIETRRRSLHRVVALPRCPVCGGATASAAAADADRFSADSPLSRVVDALAGWVDQRTGLISAVILEPHADVRAGLPFVATAAPPVVATANGSLRFLPLGWGKGLTVSGAVLSAVGEAIERYAPSLPDSDRLLWKRPDELHGEYLDPLELSLYSDAQYRSQGFPHARYNPGVRHPWVQGAWLGTNRPVWVPAILAFLSLTIEAEHLICQGTSNGLAAATDFEEAATRATYELIERDALLASWLAACPGQRLVLDRTCDRRLRQIVAAMESLGATVETYLLSRGVYGATVLCLGIGDGTAYPGATIGLGTGVDARAALHAAVLELGQTGPYLQRMMRSRTLAVPRAPASVRTMLDHAAYYFPRRRAAVFDRLRATASRVRLGDLPRCRPRQPLQHCAAALAASGIRVAVVDVTSADVASGPFRVARAVSPDLQPISFGFGMDRTPVDRIRRMGIRTPVPPVQPVW